MKLLSKLTLFITLSKLIIVVVFVLLLPFLVEEIASSYTNYNLRQQQEKVLKEVSKNGIDSYLQGAESFGSYTMLKEEYIALEPVSDTLTLDTIETEQRIVEQDTITYRILSHTFRTKGQTYLLEIGKTTSSINQYNRPLQRIALYVLISLIFLTLLIDLVFTRFLLRPLGFIIKTKLTDQQFPSNKHSPPVRTSTIDFKYLDQSLISLMEQINETFEKEREFTANASHELMTPISILQHKIENLMLLEEVNEPVQLRLIEMMKTLNRLKRIVRSLLLISRIENEQFAKSDEASVKELLDDVIEEIGHRMEEKNIKFDVKVSDRVLKNCSRDLLFQFLYNLINNAIKYNKPGGKISVSDSGKEGNYRIYIKDTGIGIPKEELPFIFNRFRKSNLQEGSGYGLGLAITKSIAEYHNIEIRIDSVVDDGTIFTLIFPPMMQ